MGICSQFQESSNRNKCWIKRSPSCLNPISMDKLEACHYARFKVNEFKKSLELEKNKMHDQKEDSQDSTKGLNISSEPETNHSPQQSSHRRIPDDFRLNCNDQDYGVQKTEDQINFPQRLENMDIHLQILDTRERHYDDNLCLLCQNIGHATSNCPLLVCKTCGDHLLKLFSFS